MLNRLPGSIAAATLLSLTPLPAAAQSFIPGVAYDPAIPTIESVLGKPSGERVTP